MMVELTHAQRDEIATRTNFTVRLLSPGRWFRLSDELVRSAEMLEPAVEEWWAEMERRAKDGSGMPAQEDLHVIAMMLIAFAIENLCKGHLVARLEPNAREIVRAKGKLPGDLQTHDLEALVRRTGMTFTLEEEDILRRSSRAGVWSGRYPVPIHWSGSRGSAVFSDGETYMTSHLQGTDLAKARKLVERLRVHVGHRGSE